MNALDVNPLCACGCGKEIDISKSRGKERMYYSKACKQRIYRKKTQFNSNVTINTMREVKPILKYPGAKWSRAKWITSYLPKHSIYLEPYCGSAAIFFNKEKSDHEIINDLNGDLVNFFTILRTRGPELAHQIMLTPWSEEEYNRCKKNYSGTGDDLEDARRFLVRCWQAHGTQFGKENNTWRHRGIKGQASTTALWKQVHERLLVAADRLRDAEIRKRPALEMIDYYNHSDCLIYADPPYVLSTRKSTSHYQFEMKDSDHSTLLEALQKHRGYVVLSGYDSTLYSQQLTGWTKVTMPTVTEHGHIQQEVLWLNPKVATTQQLTFDHFMADVESESDL